MSTASKPTPRTTTLPAICMLGAALLASCARTAQHGPPTLHVGRDECSECGMMISEDRCCAGSRAVVEGVSKELLFDDIACMMDYERAHSVQSPERYVHDYASRVWTPADSAHFLMADRETLHTPMGSGIIAFASRSAAEAQRSAAQSTTPWPILSYTDAAQARKDWMTATYGSKD